MTEPRLRLLKARVTGTPGDPSRRERFEALVLAHLDAAYNLARWILRDENAADDVVQDASLRAFRYFDGLQGPSPKAWFMAIVRNACLDWFEINRRQGVFESYDEDNHSHAACAHAPEEASPEALAGLAADSRRLHACIEALPAEFREVLILREMEGLSYREISAIVGVPVGTVMSRLSRGRDLLARRVRAAVQRKSS